LIQVIDKICQMDEETSFLDTRAPHWAANGLAYLIVIAVLLALVALIAVHVPETVTSPFVLVPTRGTDPVRASRSGIVARVRVTEGQAARKGEPLFVIQSSPIGDRASELSALETQLKGAQESLANARREHESRRQAEGEEARRLKEKIASLGQSIKLKQEQLALAKELAGRYEEGYRKGLTSQVDVIRPKMDATRMALELEEAAKDRKEAEASLEKLRHESEAGSAKQRELERSLREVMDKSRIRIAALRKELVHTQSNELSVPAPCPGIVLRLHVKAAEAFVNEGDLLGELACAGDRLQAELTVPQSGAARIRPGQGVKLLYDAFPYQRYGVRYGTVRWISPATISLQNGAGFHGFADVEDEAILIDGQPRPLRAGMRGTAKIVVGRRSLITYAFEPLRQLKESFSDVPQRSVKP
jgi:membrane fusion protein